MSLKSGFFNSNNGDRKYNAEDMTKYFKGIMSDGILETIGDAFEVTALSGMSVLVGSGRAFLGVYWLEQDASSTLTLDASEITLPRVDSVVLQMDLLNRIGSIVIKKGTPGETPAAPSLTNNATHFEKRLCNIDVDASTAAISQSDITDTRAGEDCGWVTSLLSQESSSSLTFVQVTLPAAAGTVTYDLPTGFSATNCTILDVVTNDLGISLRGNDAINVATPGRVVMTGTTYANRVINLVMTKYR